MKIIRPAPRPTKQKKVLTASIVSHLSEEELRKVLALREKLQ